MPEFNLVGYSDSNKSPKNVQDLTFNFLTSMHTFFMEHSSAQSLNLVGYNDSN